MQHLFFVQGKKKNELVNPSAPSPHTAGMCSWRIWQRAALRHGEHNMSVMGFFNDINWRKCRILMKVSLTVSVCNSAPRECNKRDVNVFEVDIFFPFFFFFLALWQKCTTISLNVVSVLHNLYKEVLTWSVA